MKLEGALLVRKHPRTRALVPHARVALGRSETVPPRARPAGRTAGSAVERPPVSGITTARTSVANPRRKEITGSHEDII